MSKPSTLKECAQELIQVIEGCAKLSKHNKAMMLDLIRTELVAYLKLKELVFNDE